MKPSWPQPVEIVVLCYCTWQARDLPTSWLSTPAVRWGWVAFLIWLLPALIYVWNTVRSGRAKESCHLLIALGVGLSLTGDLGSMHLLQHAGLACTIAGTTPFSLYTLVWLMSALGWFPAFGWLFKALPFSVLPILEIGLAAFGTMTMIIHWRHRYI